MNPMHGAESGEAVRCSAWLGVTDSWWVNPNMQCLLLILLKKLNQLGNVVWMNHNKLLLHHGSDLLDANKASVAGVNLCSISRLNLITHNQ